MRRGDASFATLAGYAGGAAVGMVAGLFMRFEWALVAAPLCVYVGAPLALVGINTIRVVRGQALPSPRLHMFAPAFVGLLWGGLAGAFAASTCASTHRTPLGSEAAAPAVACWAIALAIVADRLPPQADRYPHALGGALFLVAVILALALGAEALA
jgi:hypothetical protein